MGQDERTLQMKKEYLSLFRSGLTPQQIAEKFGLSKWTMYFYLGEIAKEAGVSRDALLVRPHKPPAPRDFRPAPVSPVDLDDFRSHYSEILGELNALRERVTNYINQQECIQEEEYEKYA